MQNENFSRVLLRFCFVSIRARLSIEATTRGDEANFLNIANNSFMKRVIRKESIGK